MPDTFETKKQEKTVVTDVPREAGVDLRLPAVVPTVPYPIETLVPHVNQQTPAVGQRVTRPDGRSHGLGLTKYIDDMAFPGMLHAKIKRAGVASAPKTGLCRTDCSCANQRGLGGYRRS